MSFISIFFGSLQPPQFKLDPRLARLLGIHTQTRPVIIQALWQYIKTHKLQDPHEREFVTCDKYLQQVREGPFLLESTGALVVPKMPTSVCFSSFPQIFESQRMKFSEIPQRLHALLMPPEPIIINHVIRSACGWKAVVSWSWFVPACTSQLSVSGILQAGCYTLL